MQTDDPREPIELHISGSFDDLEQVSMEELPDEILWNGAQVTDDVGFYDELIRRYERATPPEAQLQLAKAILGKSAKLMQQGHVDESQAALVLFVGRFHDATEPAMENLLAQALLGLGFALWQAKKYDESIAQYDALFARFHDFTDANLAEPLATAMMNKAMTLELLKRNEDAERCYNELIACWNGTKDQATLNIVGAAFEARSRLKRAET